MTKSTIERFYFFSNRKKVQEENVFVFSFYISMQNPSNLEAATKSYMDQFVIKNKENKIVIFDGSIIPIKKYIWTKWIYFHVLHTCAKSHQPVLYKKFFYGISEWSRVQPGIFCILNKTLPNSTKLWRTLKGLHFLLMNLKRGFISSPVKNLKRSSSHHILVSSPLEVLHRWRDK